MLSWLKGSALQLSTWSIDYTRFLAKWLPCGRLQWLPELAQTQSDLHRKFAITTVHYRCSRRKINQMVAFQDGQL